MWMEMYGCEFDYRNKEGKVDNINHSRGVGARGGRYYPGVADGGGC
jgi:hypothetical protein